MPKGKHGKVWTREETDGWRTVLSTQISKAKLENPDDKPYEPKGRGSGEQISGAEQFMWWFDDFVLAESQFDAQFMEADNWNEKTKLLFAERAMQCVDNTKKRATWAANLLANREKSDRQQREEEQKGEVMFTA